MRFFSTKTFGVDRGLSCSFRQWKATDSSSEYIHGCSLGFKFIFEAHTLDDKNWVYNIKNATWIEEYLEHAFGDTLVIAQDDPLLPRFIELEQNGACDLRVMPAVGCEKFAELVHRDISYRVREETDARVRLKSVEVFEHGSTSAVYEE
jgi:6-pyruvoyltetrahydropterin/6-carboxytetrahydropterin synthase